MVKFKVGDKVRAGEGSDIYNYTNKRFNYEGVVLDTNDVGLILVEYTVAFDTKIKSWVDSKHFDLIKEPNQQYPKVIKQGELKIVFNPPYTIVINGDAKGKAKCSPQDEYDPIIGLELAMSRLSKSPKPMLKELLLKEPFMFKEEKNEIKKGDKVICIDANHCSGSLQEGKTYIVISIIKSYDLKYVYLEGITPYFYINRFKRA